MYKIRVFDQLVYDNDPNLTNVLIGQDFKIWRVDFSRAFRIYKDLRDPKDLVRCDRQLFEKLKALAQVRHRMAEKPANPFRIRLGDSRVYTTFAIELEMLR
jgi:hypothetical protein